MSHFCLLKDPQNYVAHNWDLLTDPAGQAYWLEHFEKGFASAMQYAAQNYGREAKSRIAAAQKQFGDLIANLRKAPACLPGGKLDVPSLDRLRQNVLRDNGLLDPYAQAKSKAAKQAAAIYRDVVRKLHALDDQEKWLRLAECLFAGNLFDLGSVEEAPLAAGNADQFLEAIDHTQPRPWLADDYDTLCQHLLKPVPLKWTKAVFFVDNAGVDFILGVMPLARELALHGVQIVLAANEQPALNDITVDETVSAIENLAHLDQDLAALVEAKMFEVASTGSGIPLLDLSQVSDELNHAAADADLVILEGMGRAVETNYNVQMKVDCLHLALLKNTQIAARLGGQLYDCICKYTPGT